MELSTLFSRIQRRLGKTLVIAPPFVWMFLFFLLPFLFVLKISFSESMIASPPHAPLFEYDPDEGVVNAVFRLFNYQFLLEDDLYLKAYLSSLKIAAMSTLACLLVGFPFALALARSSRKHQPLLLIAVMLPFWTSLLIRVYASIGILRQDGIMNNILLSIGIIDEPIILLQTQFATYIGIVYTYLPFMVLPIYAVLEKQDLSLLEAARDLGARPFRSFVDVTLPLAVPGIIAGSMLVFIPAVGEFVIPTLLSGESSLMIGRVLWNEFFLNRDWPVASAVAVVMLMVLLVPIMIFQRQQARQGG